MAKRDKKQRPARVTRKYHSRVEQERRQLRYIRIGTAIFVAFIVLLAVAGLFKSQVVDPAATRQAKEALKERPERFVGIVVDWRLPDMEGLELLRWIRARAGLSDVETVMESEAFVSDDVQEGIRAGAYYYLTKPYEESQLRAIVKAAISSCELKRNLRERVRHRRDAFRLLEKGVFKLKTARAINDAIREALKTVGSQAKVWVIPQGNSTLPRVKPAGSV